MIYVELAVNGTLVTVDASLATTGVVETAIDPHRVASWQLITVVQSDANASPILYHTLVGVFEVKVILYDPSTFPAAKEAVTLTSF